MSGLPASQLTCILVARILGEVYTDTVWCVNTAPTLCKRCLPDDLVPWRAVISSKAVPAFAWTLPTFYDVPEPDTSRSLKIYSFIWSTTQSA